MPNDNISFNSIDELQHFHTTEDPFVMGALPGSTFSDGRLIDSGRFLTEPAKREAFDTDIGEVLDSQWWELVMIVWVERRIDI